MFGVLTVLLSLCVVGRVVEASGRIGVTSTVLGDGWFSYQVRIESTPFFSQQIVGTAAVIFFQDYVDGNSAPAGWSDGSADSFLHWSKDDQQQSHGFPLEFTILGRSSSSGFRTETNGFIVGFIAWPQTWFQSPLVSQNIAGFVKLPVLVPCDLEESDGSPVELYAFNDVIPDPRICEMGSDYLKYEWGAANVMDVEASYDLVKWNWVGRIQSEVGITTWHSSQPLDELGTFFSVRLSDKSSSAKSSMAQKPSAGSFVRLLPEGVLVAGPDGTSSLVPVGAGDGLWCVPVTLP